MESEVSLPHLQEPTNQCYINKIIQWKQIQKHRMKIVARSRAGLWIVSNTSSAQDQSCHVPLQLFNPLTPNDHYSGRTAPLISKRFILYIYSTNIGTEYFKHGIYSPFFPLQNVLYFLILTYLVTLLFTLYIQGVLKFKKIISAPKG